MDQNNTIQVNKQWTLVLIFLIYRRKKYFYLIGYLLNKISYLYQYCDILSISYRCLIKIEKKRYWSITSW